MYIYFNPILNYNIYTNVQTCSLMTHISSTFPQNIMHNFIYFHSFLYYQGLPFYDYIDACECGNCFL